MALKDEAVTRTELTANTSIQTTRWGDEDGDEEDNYLKGTKLNLLTLAYATLELSIVSTSLVAITDSLQGFDRVSWVVTAYFLTYSGMVVQAIDW
ncbi:hypothetical protein MMC17_009097 [Xylographa soralifera]|nr:hypothetical protein [Xylographa soralifera]